MKRQAIFNNYLALEYIWKKKLEDMVVVGVAMAALSFDSHISECQKNTIPYHYLILWKSNLPSSLFNPLLIFNPKEFLQTQIPVWEYGRPPSEIRISRKWCDLRFSCDGKKTNILNKNPKPPKLCIDHKLILNLHQVFVQPQK